jgi:hypothetical protein
LFCGELELGKCMIETVAKVSRGFVIVFPLEFSTLIEISSEALKVQGD